MSATLTQLSPPPQPPEITEQMIEIGARAAFDALIDGRSSGPLRFDQLPSHLKARVVQRFSAGIRAAFFNEAPPAQRYGLTQRQRKCLDFIADYIAGNGRAPTYREIADAMNWANRGTVNQFINALEKRGYLRRLPGHIRSIQLIPWEGQK